MRELGLAHRNLLRATLAYLIMYVINVVGSTLNNEFLLGLSGVMFLVTFPWLAYTVWKLIRLQRLSWFWYLALFPWLGLLGLFALSRKTSLSLRAAGIPVAFMGPKVIDLPTI